MESSENPYNPDELMSERLERVEDGRIRCPVNKVGMSRDNVISIVVDTPSSVKSCDFIIPEIPTSDTQIVQLCRYYGVDPDTPSRLEDKMVEWDGNEIYFERVMTPTENFKSMFSFNEKLERYLWYAFFFVFFPITGLTERMYTSRVGRPMMRETFVDYLILFLVWIIFLFGVFDFLVWGI